MSDSLRDQLLKAGLAPTRAEPARKIDQREQKRNTHAPQSQSKEDLDLARAYALRAQTEKAERDRAAREAERQARQRRECKRRLHELLAGKTLAIAADAECVRHFEHAGKIRRVHVDADQLVRLNSGELGVVVQAGRFLLVPRELAIQVGEIASDTVALLVDPDATSDTTDDDVPDDLMW